jgi:hypothetical protein
MLGETEKASSTFRRVPCSEAEMSELAQENQTKRSAVPHK